VQHIGKSHLTLLLRERKEKEKLEHALCTIGLGTSFPCLVIDYPGLPSVFIAPLHLAAAKTNFTHHSETGGKAFQSRPATLQLARAGTWSIVDGSRSTSVQSGPQTAVGHQETAAQD
jgi:hypothetical protein